MMSLKKKIEVVINRELQDRTFEDILYDFDLEPDDVFFLLFRLGYIDQDLFERLYEQE